MLLLGEDVRGVEATGEYKVLDFLRSDILRRTPTLGMVEKGNIQPLFCAFGFVLYSITSTLKYTVKYDQIGRAHV